VASEYVQVETTLDDRQRAAGIVVEVLHERLAACGQIRGPVDSAYWWRRAIEEAQEWTCVFKTRADLVPKLTAFIRERHPYELPEIIVIAITPALPEYGDWIRNETERR
jgi:periplasmic divalent cation tolerance protein